MELWGRDSILTKSEIHGYLLNSITVPHAGEFANNETGSDMALSAFYDLQ